MTYHFIEIYVQLIVYMMRVQLRGVRAYDERIANLYPNWELRLLP